ncbi:LPS-assembly protein LptD [Phorcysia thermohydrogeniphila]|uniref:LPS-assembly protein n=1 Tax=Phorcysia thermohydrogeniphila TaxID=936138 RepID=A0A4R1G8D7_9BACT|nr:LPS assembly protein LptD [Phorcysia thermohydrogeniphila]TCK03848.1 LPS-assembly protein [Phorcysia thermohydrogeniphila]
MKVGLWAFAFWLFLFSRALAVEVPVNITADKVFGNVSKRVEARGHVVITYDKVEISGDSAVYDREKGLLIVRGNVVVKEFPASFRCQSIVYDLKTKRAVLEGVSGKISETDYIKADRIERLSEKEWIAYDGEYTPCKHTCPDWSVGAKRFRILLGESFEGRWVAFRVKEIPIFVSPVLSGPIVKKRTTGFLFPRFGYMSEDGFIYRQPFYIVLGRSADLTLTYEKRFRDGDGKSAELRYVLSEKSKGRLYYYRIDRENRRDWKFTYSHSFYPSELLYGRLNAELVNSREYYKSTTTFDVEEKTRVYTKSDVTLSKLWEHAILNVNAVYLDYLDGSSSTVYQRVPNVNFYLMDIPLPKTPFTFSFDTELTYFYREAGGSSYRLNLEPILKYSRFFGVFKNTMKVSYLISKYQLGGDRSIFKFESKTVTNKYFHLGDTVSVSLNPELSFRFVESENQEVNPFYDGSDRVGKKKEIYSGVTGYFYEDGKEFLRLSISGQYDLYDSEDPWKLWRLDLDLYPLGNLELKETFYYSPEENGLKKSNTYVSVSWGSLSLWANYYSSDLTERVRYVRWGTELKIGVFSLSYRQRYDLELSQDRERSYSLAVNRGCWSGRLTYRWVKNYDNTVDYQVSLLVNLVKLGSYGYKFVGRK